MEFGITFEHEIRWAIEDAITVGDLIQVLSKYQKDTKIINISNLIIRGLKKKNIYEITQGYVVFDWSNFYKKDHAKNPNENED